MDWWVHYNTLPQPFYFILAIFHIHKPTFLIFLHFADTRLPLTDQTPIPTGTQRSRKSVLIKIEECEFEDGILRGQWPRPKHHHHHHLDSHTALNHASIKTVHIYWKVTLKPSRVKSYFINRLKQIQTLHKWFPYVWSRRYDWA